MSAEPQKAHPILDVAPSPSLGENEFPDWVLEEEAERDAKGKGKGKGKKGAKSKAKAQPKAEKPAAGACKGPTTLCVFMLVVL